MYFHFNKENLELRIEQSVTSQQGFFRKQLNPKINDFRNVQAKVHCNRLIGKTWIQDNYLFQDQIEEYQINQNNVQVLLKDSLQLQIIRRNNVEFQKVRRNANHRISLHTNHIVNYNDCTINGVFDERVNQEKHYIAELNVFYEDLQLMPKIIFKKWLCQQIKDNLYLLQLYGDEEQINILIDEKGKQVDFYENCSNLQGQVSYFDGYFFWFHENQLKILNENGITYQEQLIGKYYLYKDCAISIDSQTTIETNGKNQINFLTTIKYHKLHLLLVKKEEKFKIIFAEQVVPPEKIVEYLQNTNDYKFIKMKMKEYWSQSIIKQLDIIQLFANLCQLKKSNKNSAKYKLLQCYQIQPKLLNISFMDCLLSPKLDCEQFTKLFKKQLLYNYVHFLILIINHRPELIDFVLPNGQLFGDIDQSQTTEIKLLSKCQLNDLNYLGNDSIQLINTNYFQLAHQVFGAVFGQYRQAQLLANNFIYYLYNILIKDSKSRMTYQEFEEQPNKVNIVLSQSINITLTLDQLKSYYDQNQLDFNSEMLNQLQISDNFAQIFQQLMNYELPQDIYLKAITLVFDKISTQSSDSYQQLYNICGAIRNQLWNINQQNQPIIHDILSNIDQIAKISEVLYNFNIIYKIHSLQTRLMKSQEDCLKCVDQLLENYMIGRVKKQQFKAYNLSLLQDLKQLLNDYFAPYVRESNLLNTIILKKHLEFGKYRESKQICQQFLFSIQQLDQVISQTMYRYLELQKKVESIEEERCKFQEIIAEIKRSKKQEMPLCKQALNLYKFIYEIKEIGDYKFNDQQSCNQSIYQIFRRTNNLELPYLRLKKKLAKANNLEIYDLDFCRFMLDLAQKNISSNPQRAQLIFEELQKNGNEIIQSEVSVQLLQFSNDESQKSEHYWRVLKQSQSADAISTLIRLYKPKSEFSIKPKKIEILNMDLIAIPLTTKSDQNKFQNEYLKLYPNQNNKFEVVFLDKLLTDPKQAFYLLKQRKYENQMVLIQNICNSELLNNYKLLTLFIRTLSDNQDIIQQLQQGGIVEQVAEAIIISKHKQLFNKEALFYKHARKTQILELLKNLDLDNLIPELNYFRDLDLQDLKLQVFVNKLQSINLKDYYINQQESIRSVINNQIKQNPLLKSIDMDCRYHWIMHQDILDFTVKEKILIRSLVNQCVLSDHLDCWDRIYRKLIERNKDYSLIEQDLAIIVDTENNIILYEIVKAFYNQEVEFMKLYYRKLIQTNQEPIIQKWLTDCPDQWKVELLKSVMSDIK